MRLSDVKRRGLTPTQGMLSGVLIMVSSGAYLWLAYLPRIHFITFISLYLLIFVAYLGLLWMIHAHSGKIRLWYMIAAGFLFRLMFLFSGPELSDDYYRFLWDGRLNLAGEDVFAQTPSEWKDAPVFSGELYKRMNSPDYYTVYPPVLQAVFTAGAQVSGEDTATFAVILRIFILMAEAGTLWFLIRIFREQKLPEHKILMWFINPLVIVELTGNLHFEAFMILALAGTFWWLNRQRPVSAGLGIAVGIGSKLLPAAILPLGARYAGLKKGPVIVFTTATAVGVMFLPLLISGNLPHMLQSIRLYYESFEFNGSFYYLLRTAFSGSSFFPILRQLMSLVPVFLLVFLTILQKKNDFRQLVRFSLFFFSVYLFAASIVHPWYITPLIFLSTLTSYRYPLVWSALIPFSYITYISMPYKEEPMLIFMEYFLLFAFMMIEMVSKNAGKSKPQSVREPVGEVYNEF